MRRRRAAALRSAPDGTRVRCRPLTSLAADVVDGQLADAGHGGLGAVHLHLGQGAGSSEGVNNYCSPLKYKAPVLFAAPLHDSQAPPLKTSQIKPGSRIAIPLSQHPQARQFRLRLRASWPGPPGSWAHLHTERAVCTSAHAPCQVDGAGSSVCNAVHCPRGINAVPSLGAARTSPAENLELGRLERVRLLPERLDDSLEGGRHVCEVGDAAAGERGDTAKVQQGTAAHSRGTAWEVAVFQLSATRLLLRQGQACPAEPKSLCTTNSCTESILLAHPPPTISARGRPSASVGGAG